MTRILKLCLLLFIFCLTSPAQSAHAQGGDAPPSPGLQPTLHFSHLTTADGLSHNFVRTILQDRQGFMWIGTEGGLNRYDGYEFTVYQYDHHDPHSLSDNYVMDLYEDTEGNIWVATQGGGVNRFDPLTETFTRYRHDPDNPNSLAGDTIFSIFQDSRGNFWFGGPPALGDLTRYDPTTETFTRYSRPEGFEAGGVWDMIEDENGNLWLAADSVLVRFNPETEQFAYFAPDPVDRRLAALHQAGDGTFWVGGREGLYRFDPSASSGQVPQTGAFTLHQPGRPVAVNSILPNDDGTFWIATGDGLYLFDPTVSRFTHEYQPDPTYEFSLGHNNVQDLYRDRAGVLWIGTVKGVDLYDPRQSQFTHYRHQPENPNSLAVDAVWGVAGDQDGSLWVGTGETLSRLDPATGQVAHYPFKATSRPDVPTNGVIFSDQAGFIWVTTRTTLHRFDKARGEFTAAYDMQSSRPPGGPPMEINSLYHDGSVLWLGVLRAGLIRFDLQSETFQTYHEPPPELRGVADPRYYLHLEVTTIYGDREGYIWLGYGTGELSRFDPKSDTFIHFRPDANDPDSIATGWITDIYQDQAGILWLASQRGLTRFDPSAGSGQAPQAESFTLYTEKDGLPSSYVTGIRPDNQGNLWLATLKGLSKFDPQTETFRNYDVADGVGSAEFWGASWQSADGRMFFGGDDGLTAFYPDQISDSPYQPPVVLTGFSLFNRPVAVGEDSLLQQPLWKTDHLTLQHDQNSITFEFAALSYAASPKNRYRYKLEGLEENWNEVGSDHRLAAYTNLPPGEYVFRVQGSNNRDLWSDQEAALEVTIIPPWWSTTWFRLAAIVLSVGLVAAGIRWRMHALEQRSRALEAEVAERTRELAARTRRLQESEEQYRLLAENVTDVIFTLDLNLRYTYVSPSVKTLRGFEPEEVVGNAITDMLSPDSLARAMQFIREHMELEQQEGVAIELEMKHKDGALIWTEVMASLIRDETGTPIGILGVTRDISARKRIERELKESEKRFREMAELLPGAVVEMDANFTITYVNRSGLALFGYTEADVKAGINSIELIHQEDREKLAGRIAGHFEGKDVPPTEYRILKKDGAEVSALLKAAPIIQKGEVAGFRVSITDLSKVKEAEQELAAALDAARRLQHEAETANRAKSTFLANMSHELRTPLNAIIGFTQIIARSKTLPQKQQENLAIINRSGEHLLALINQVLELSKIEAGRMTLNKTVFNLHQMLTELEGMFRLRADDKQLRLIFERSPDVPRTIRTDEVKLRQVLINLLNNALKFTEEGSVTLRVGSRKYEVGSREENTPLLPTSYSRQHTVGLHFEVSDTGPGIAPEEIPGLFEAFSQTETGQQAQEGTGLGLPISRKFVQLLGGDDIKVESPKKKSKIQTGATFAFNVPVEVVDPAEIADGPYTNELIAEIGARVVSLAPNQPRYRLLIVDDDPINRKLLYELFAPLGFDLREAENGQQAIEIWQEFQPHLIWMDMRMPVMDGYEATKIIKSKQSKIHKSPKASFGKSKIIALTASSFEEEKANIQAIGCDDYLRKPFREADLFQVMSQHIGVQFVYEESPDLPATGDKAAKNTPAPEMMALVSPDHLAGLAEAIEVSNVELANQIIDANIRPSQPELAETLSRLVNDFEYSAILTAIEQVTSAKWSAK